MQRRAAAAGERDESGRSERDGVCITATTGEDRHMSDYSKLNLRDVENAAPKFDMPDEMQARFA